MLRPVTIADGLSQNSVRTILYDSEGYLWLGTKYGLNRYDHSGITNYFADPASSSAITANDIVKVFEDANDTLWIAAERGLTRYDRRTGTFSPVECAGLPVNIHSFCEMPEGLLLGGAGRLYSYEYATGTPTLIGTSGGSKYYYSRIHHWTGGKYMLETRWDGLWVYDPATLSISRFKACPDTNIMVSYVDSGGNLWVSPYNEGLRCYNPSGHIVYEADARTSGLTNNIVIDMIEHDGNLWIATEGGIDILDRESGVFSHLDGYNSGPFIGTVLNLSKDDFGNIYAGTLRHGALCIYNVPMRTYTHSRPDRPEADFIVTSLYEDSDGSVWCGIDGDGVVNLDLATDRFKRYSSTAGLKVTGISPFDERRLLIATYDKGIHLFDKESGSLSAAPKAHSDFATANARNALAMEIYPLDDTRDLIVTDMVYVADRTDGTYHKARNSLPDMKDRKLYAFYRDDKRMLLTGPHRLLQYDPATDSLWTIASTKPDIMVKCAQFDGFRTIYVGTSSGLYKYDMVDRNFTPIEAKLIQNISALVLDGKKLWIGADNVLYLLDGGTLRIFNASDGVAPNEFICKAWLLTDDYAFMGGFNGLQKINRAIIDSKELDPANIQLGLSDISVDGVSAFASVSDGTVKIPSYHSSIVVKVIDRERNAFRKKLFRFYIDGLDLKTPIETFDRTLSLNALPPGHNYKVSVACSRPDGSWTPPKEIIEIKVKSPWWMTWWAIAVYIAIGIAAVYAVYRYVYIRKRRQLDEFKRQTLEREVGFLSNINYELRTPLSLIYAPLKLLIRRLRNSNSVDKSTIDDLEMIYRHTKEMRDVINMPLELWHIESASAGAVPEMCKFNAWVEQEVEASAAAIGLRRMHVTYDLDNAIDEVAFDRSRMGIVMANMLMAAIKHSPRGSTLHITTSTTSTGNIRVEIHDQGDSLSEAEIQQVFSGHYNNNLYGAGLGLAYAKMLMELQQGRVGVESDPGTPGVTLWMEMPCVPQSTPVISKPEDEITETSGAVDSYDTSVNTAIVVEGNEELCMFMVSHLQEIFKKVYYAFNGRDALMLIKRDSPDIVIADGVLPVIGGFDLCRQIKESNDMQHIPVILLTAGPAEAKKLWSYSYGADSYISKPFDINVIITRCKNLLLNREIMRNRYRNSTLVVPPDEKKLSNADESFLMKIDRIIASDLSSPDFGVDIIVEKMLMSRSAMYTRFKDLTGKSIGTYIAEYRLAKAKEMLARKSVPINEISEALGFRSQRYFSTFFKERVGMTPTAYRTSGAHTEPKP